MSIKPIDYQMIVPRTTEVAKTANEEKNRNHLQQQQQSVSVQNKAENDVKQVHSQEKSQDVKLRERQKKQEKDEKSKKNKKNYSVSKEVNNESSEGSTIDIKI